MLHYIPTARRLGVCFVLSPAARACDDSLRTVFSVMVGVDHCDQCMMHVSFLRTAGNVKKVEFQCLSIG
jgi:hypothetical protein